MGKGMKGEERKGGGQKKNKLNKNNTRKYFINSLAGRMPVFCVVYCCSFDVYLTN